MASHRIHTIEIEFEVGEVALAEALSERLSRLHERRLAAMLDRVCSELSGPERLDRIDTLELDLGPLEPGLGPTGSSEFDDEFMRKLEAALRSQLRRVLGESRTADAAERAALELLETYARTGNLPWWADRSDPDPVAAQLRLALAHAPEPFFALLRALADDALGLARLARHGDAAWIEALAQRVGGAELLVDLREFEALLARLDVASTSRPNPESSRESSSRVGKALLGVVSRGVRADQVVGALVLEVVANQPSVIAALRRVDSAASLSARLRAAMAPMLPIAAGDASEGARASEEVRASDEGEEVDASDEVDASEEVDEVDASDNAAAPPDPSSDDSPEPATPVLNPAPDLEAASLARAPEPATPDAPEHAADRDERLERPPANESPRATLAQARAAIAKRTKLPEPPALRLARRRALEQLDTLEVEDAGLVIAWPFLERFFAIVGLLDDERQFLDEPARMQAIALLSQVAFEDPDPPEHRLALAKLLCGCSPAAAFELDRPVPPEAIDECERLIGAIIANAPILRDTSVASFRANFIQRPGLLSVREGGWSLVVEPRPHDLVLDRFAWSWSWVKLRWMADPLSVQW